MLAADYLGAGPFKWRFPMYDASAWTKVSLVSQTFDLSKAAVI